jgi:hypothetical protein
MGDLARIDDAEAVDIPPHGIGGLIDPPIMVVTDTNVTPAESRSCFGHEREKFFSTCERCFKKQAQNRE